MNIAFIDHEVTVTLTVTTTDDDLRDALARSGFVAGNVIGETLIVDVETYGDA